MVLGGLVTRAMELRRKIPVTPVARPTPCETSPAVLTGTSVWAGVPPKLVWEMGAAPACPQLGAAGSECPSLLRHSQAGTRYGMLWFKEVGGQHRVHWHQPRLCHPPVCPAVVGFALSATCLGASDVIGRGQAPLREGVGSLGAQGLWLTQK